MAGDATAREELETSVTTLLDDAAFDAAFSDSTAELSGEEAKPEPEVKPEVPEVPEPEVTPEVKPEVPDPEVKPETKPVEAAPAATAAEIAQAVAEALKPVTEKPAEPELEAETPEELAALADLEKNWETTAVAVGVLLKRQEKLLEAKFAKILEPLQAQLAPMVAATAESAQEKFNATLLAAHADAFDIIPEVETWIATQPAYLKKAYNDVLDTGTAKEVSEFLTNYKTATGKVDTAAQEAAASKLATEKAAQAEAAKRLKKMETPTTARTSVTAEADPTDFDSAFEAGTKIALAM